LTKLAIKTALKELIKILLPIAKKCARSAYKIVKIAQDH
jgi:hypothetical protein